MQVSTFLWFDGVAEAAAAHYIRAFDDGRILSRERGAGGAVTTVTFELAGQRCVAYDGGPGFAFTGAISLYAVCEGQAEVDRAWAVLTEGGREGPGGSLTDRFGVSWQVVPTALAALLGAADPDAAARVLSALHAMTRIDIQGLVDARDG